MKDRGEGDSLLYDTSDVSITYRIDSKRNHHQQQFDEHFKAG